MPEVPQNFCPFMVIIIGPNTFALQASLTYSTSSIPMKLLSCQNKINNVILKLQKEESNDLWRKKIFLHKSIGAKLTLPNWKMNIYQHFPNLGTWQKIINPDKNWEGKSLFYVNSNVIMGHGTGYSFWDPLLNSLHKFIWIVLSVHKLNKLGKFW